MAEIIEPEVKKMSPFSKIVNIFVDPIPVFENLRQRPTWVLPLILSIVMSFAFVYFAHEPMVELQKESIYDNSLIPEEAKDVAVEQLETESMTTYLLKNGIGGAVGVVVVFLVVPLILLGFGNFIYGGKAKYVQLLAVFSWTSIIGILESLVKLLMVLNKGSMKVYTSLAVFMDPAQAKTAIFQIMDAFDVFTIWKIILLSLGFGIVYKFGKGKSFAAVIILFVLYMAIKIGISQLF